MLPELSRAIARCLNILGRIDQRTASGSLKEGYEGATQVHRPMFRKCRAVTRIFEELEKMSVCDSCGPASDPNSSVPPEQQTALYVILSIASGELMESFSYGIFQ